MAAIFANLVKFYNFAFVDYVDPRSRKWFLASSPFPMFAIAAFYLYFVNSLGPRLMANRPPFKIDRILIVYNVLQILVCAYIFSVGRHVWIGSYNYFCQPVDFENNELNDLVANTVYLYYMVKISDLLDTVFFVLRKKFSQASFLHLYHHGGMLLVGYLGCKYSLNGHFTLLGILNSFVHVIMYSYYLVTALWPQHKNNVWWKKYITLLQLIQFVILLIHAALPLLQPSCQVVKIWCYGLVTQYIVMIILFGDFYRKTYLKKRD